VNDPLDFVDRLARHARRESPRQVEVASRVLVRLQAQPVLLRRPMVVFAAGYAALAVIALIYGFNVLSAAQDPLANAFRIAAGLVS
jgi:uncharacterized membrane protein YjjP (DUF1212 family)